jgi:hypothetical protein
MQRAISLSHWLPHATRAVVKTKGLTAGVPAAFDPSLASYRLWNASVSARPATRCLNENTPSSQPAT